MSASNPKTEKLNIRGMSCVSCKNRIEKKLRALKGVTSVSVDYAKGTAHVVYDDATNLGAIISAIESLDYKVVRPGENGGRRTERNNFIGALLLIFALYIFLNGAGGGFLGDIFNFFPQAEEGMGYWALFAVGLLTSVHCVAMCGGINLSQSLAAANETARPKGGSLSLAGLRPAILYNMGRVVSYAAIGGIVGALGSVVSFSGAMKGVVQMAAGIFMTILGLNMLGMFGFLRAFAPRLPRSLTSRLEDKKRGRGPLFVGMLNGLMPCGPLQAMQIYALSTGSPLKGAISMLFFSLGTVPLMFGLGAFGSLMSRKFAGRVMRAGAILVIVMGVVMFSNGATLSGLGLEFDGIGNSRLETAQETKQNAVAQNPAGIQEITTPLPRRGYPSLTVKAGTPVRWNLYAEKGSLNGCNNAIVIREYGIEKRLQVGDNIIEFTPTKTGKFRYSCWMGMIRGTITVTEDTVAAAGAAEAAEFDKADKESGKETEEELAAPSCACCGGGY
jgi:sulfite exporter TauE/SafE/copper chaperone CopZ